MSDDFIDEKMQMVDLLQNSRRYDEALSILTEVLAHDPEFGDGHYEMARTLSLMEGKKRLALESVDNAIQCDAEDPYYYAIKTQLLLDLNKNREAHECADTTMRLAPDWEVSYGIKGQCYAAQERWADAEGMFREALANDADSESAGNYLAHCLRMQNKLPDTDETIGQLLSENPEEPLTHFNAGWAAMQRGDSAKAEEHFTEALRLDPEFDHARQGLLDSFKSRSAFYRAYLNYSYFMQQFTAKARWLIIIGMVVGVRMGRKLLETVHPILGIGLIVIYLLFVLWIWLAEGIGNLFILLDSKARLALLKPEVLNAITVGGGFFLALILIFSGLALEITPLAFAGGFLGLSTIPSAMTFTNPSKLGRGIFGSMVALFYLGFLLCLAGIVFERAASIAQSGFVICIFLTVACTWLGNISALQEERVS